MRLAARAAGAGKGEDGRGEGVVSHVASTAPSCAFSEVLQRPDCLLLLLPHESVASLAENLCGVVE